MILYHFTTEDKLPSIERQGLMPQPGDHMTGGAERVWLTAQPDLSLTPREAKQLFDHGQHELDRDKGRFVPLRTWITTTPGKRFMRLSLRLRSNDRRLHRWAAWSGRKQLGLDLRSLAYARLWYVYTGMIRPDQISEIVAV